MRSELPDYERLQDELVRATGPPGAAGAATILELGTGTGETARRVLDAHPGARLHGGHDLPSTVADRLRWLHDAGLMASIARMHGDLAVLVAQL